MKYRQPCTNPVQREWTGAYLVLSGVDGVAGLVTEALRTTHPAHQHHEQQVRSKNPTPRSSHSKMANAGGHLPPADARNHVAARRPLPTPSPGDPHPSTRIHPAISRARTCTDGRGTHLVGADDEGGPGPEHGAGGGQRRAGAGHGGGAGRGGRAEHHGGRHGGWGLSERGGGAGGGGVGGGGRAARLGLGAARIV